METLLTLDQVAERLGVTRGTVAQLITDKKLRCVRLNEKRVRIRPEAVEEFIVDFETKDKVVPKEDDNGTETCKEES